MIGYPDNFSREELLHSETAQRLRIDNTPVSEQHELNLLVLSHWLQRLRDKLEVEFGKEIPITVSSGYRRPSLNTKVGGVNNSYHLEGLAADIVASGMTSYELLVFIKTHFLDYEEVIDEYGRWVHIALPSFGRESMKRVKGKGYIKV